MIMIKFKMYSKKILSVISVLCLCFMNLSRVNAATKIAKLIIFSTTEQYNKIIMEGKE